MVNNDQQKDIFYFKKITEKNNGKCDKISKHETFATELQSA